MLALLYGATQFAKHSDTNVLDERDTHLLFIEFVVENNPEMCQKVTSRTQVRHTHTRPSGFGTVNEEPFDHKCLRLGTILVS